MFKTIMNFVKNTAKWVGEFFASQIKPVEKNARFIANEAKPESLQTAYTQQLRDPHQQFHHLLTTKEHARVNKNPATVKRIAKEQLSIDKKTCD